MGSRLRRYSIVFPAVAMVVTVACASASGAEDAAVPVKKSTTTTVKKSKKKVTVTTKAPAKGAAAGTALAMLRTIPVANENGSGYSRSLFTHWIDADGDSCNTREEVLIAESLSNAQVDRYGCKVVEGDWVSPYDNVRHSYPAGLDIDHMVPLKEAWDSGANSWSSSRRRAYANDLSDARTLIAVTNSVNRSKGDKDPSNWIPSESSYLCTYLSNWVAIKKQWSLSMDRSEWGRIKNLLTDRCPTTTVAPWGTAPEVPARSSGGNTAPPTSSSGGPADSGSDTNSDSNTDTGAGTGTGAGDINPGSYCSPLGATGTYKGNSYVCSTTSATGTPYKDGRGHWRRG